MLDSLYGYAPINHLSKEEQQLLIQRAKYEAYTTLGLAGRGILYFVLSLALMAILMLILPSFISSALVLIICMVSFLVCYQLLTKSLILQGLQSILAKQASRHEAS